MEQNLNSPKQSTSPELSRSEVSVRTMESDIKGLEQGGGELGSPEYLTPERVEVKKENKFEISGYTGPEKAIFSPSAGISSIKKEEENISEEKEEKITAGEKSAKWKIIGVVVVALAVIAGFGFLGYFVVSKIFFPNEMPAAQ